MLISGLPYKLQQPVTTILNNHVKNFSQDSNNSTILGINYASGPKSTNATPNYKTLSSLLNSSSHHDHDTQLSHVIKDIQSLTVNNITSNNNKYDPRASEMSLLINERFTTSRLDSLSKDSGIQSNGGDLDQFQESEFAKFSVSKQHQQPTRFKSIDLIIDALSSNSSTNEQLIQTFSELSQTIQFGTKFDSKLSENFSTILIRIFDFLPNKDVSLRGDFVVLYFLYFLCFKANVQLSALTSLRDLLQFHSKEFSNYIELTICKLVDNYKDIQNEVSKMVEEVLYTTVQCLSPEQCIFVLKPIIVAKTDPKEFPKSLIALRMLEKILLNSANNEMCRRYLGDILPPLLIVRVLFLNKTNFN